MQEQELVKNPNVLTFKALMDAATEVAKERIAAREKAEAILNVVKAAEAEQRRALTRMNKCAYFAEWMYNPMEWYEENLSTDVRKNYVLETPDYYFSIMMVTTGQQLKPYEVRARIWKTDLSTNPSEVNGGYRMESYGKERYGEGSLTSRHKTLAEAQLACTVWQSTLYVDHADEIDYCRYLRKLAIAEGVKYTNEEIIPWARG